MSGGIFDYFVDRIQEEIDNTNTKSDWREDEYWDGGYRWTDDTISEFKKGIEFIQKTKIYIQRIDKLLAGADGEDTFHERLKEDLKELEKNKYDN